MKIIGSDKLGEGTRSHTWRSAKWAQYLDVLVGFVLAAALYFPLARKDLGEIVGVITLLLLTTKYSLQAYVEEQLDPIKGPIQKLTEVIDLDRRLNVDEIENLMDVYVSITETEFRQVKEKILSDAATQLKRISQQKKTDELSTGDYYAWLLPILHKVEKSEKVQAVSMMFDAEWDDSPQESKFIQENLAAAKRGAVVERIFVMPRSELPKALVLPPVAEHIKGRNTRLQGFFVDLDYLKKSDPQLFSETGHGFINIGERVALIDKFSAGEVRGQVTMDPTEIRQLARVFDKLKLYATELTVDLAHDTKLLESSNARLITDQRAFHDLDNEPTPSG